MMQDDALAPLRSIGMRAIVIFLWANVALLLPIGLLIGSPDAGLGQGLALLMAAVPTWCWLRGQTDRQTRCAFAIALIFCPMLFVYLFRGHPWQMDMHMYFFVCFSLLILLCDPIPILAAAGFTVLHHLALDYVLPEWVFPGSGNFSRVLLHGVLVSCQVAILLIGVRLITRLTMTNVRAREEADGARARIEEALKTADHARAEAETALNHSRDAEARATHERRNRLVAEKALQDINDSRRRATADQIEESIGVLLGDLQLVSDNIAQQASDIASVSTALVEQAGAMSTSSADAVGSIEIAAGTVGELTQSIRSVGSNAQAAQYIATAAADSISSLDPGIEKLAHEVDTACEILAMVTSIAGQSNLLALNASIEAARSGDAGRGFAVVAGEMKQMASATGRAATEIATKLAGIVAAANAFRDLIATSTAHVDEIKQSNAAIFTAVEEQQLKTVAIADTADKVLAKALDTDRRSRALTQVAANNNRIAGDAAVLAHQLGERAEQLRERMDGLLAELRAA